MHVFVYGSDARLAECERLLRRGWLGENLFAGRFRDIHLLPIPSRAVTMEEVRRNLFENREGVDREKKSETSSCSSARVTATCDAQGGRDHSHREGVNTGASFLEEAQNCVDEMPEKSLVIGYEVPSFLHDLDGVEVFDLACDERFLWRNARLCALGMVGILLTEHTRVPSEMRIGVIGYGRIGKEVCDLLAFLGAPLVVFTSNSEVVPSLQRQKASTVLVNWKEKSVFTVNECLQNSGIPFSLDILINTSPAPMGEVFYEGFRGTVYDLASGKPIPERVTHTRLASLPMRMYAKSAGFAVYRAIVEKYAKGTEEDKELLCY